MPTNSEMCGAHRGREVRWLMLLQGLLIALAAGGLTGCVSVKEELAREQAGVSKSWSALNEAPRAAHVLIWDEAVEQTRRHNPKVKAAAIEVLRAEEAFDQVRRSLIPGVSVQSGYNRAFDNGAGAGFDPFYFAANLFFDVPGLINFRVRHEAAVLALTRARLMRDLVWREQVTELCRLALADSRMATRVAGWQRQAQALDTLAATAPRLVAQERGRVQTGQVRLITERAELQARLGDILGLPGASITVAAGSLPELRYEQPAGRPSPVQLAQLSLRLAAVDLVALRARQLGVRMQGWPEVTVSVSSPTIYRRTGGRDDYWSSSDVFAGVNAYWTLDTRGRRASQTRIATVELANRREMLEQEAIRMAAKLRLALDSLGRTDARLAEVQRALAEAPPALRMPLLEARDALKGERQEWQLVLWFFDDAGWPAEVPA